MSTPNELYSLLIPLRDGRILVPRMCVAEVIAFADTERRDDDNAPDWLLGSVDWNGRRVPVISLDHDETESDQASARKGSRSRIVIFHAIGGKLRSGYYGVLTQGFPQLVRVNRDVLTIDEGEPLPEGQPMLCRVQMIHEFPLIPDLETIEQRLVDLQSAA
ncbi:MAG: chemotaxis protein CheW [Gammaproteobacteria bacterium]|jgi:chemosensory pili system protein ChpC